MNDLPPGDTSADLAWAHALEVYAMPGVSTALLLLQDRVGVDVCVLLHAMYLKSRRGVLLDDPGIASADARVEAWRLKVVAPLRALRRLLAQEFSSLPPRAVADTRSCVKEAELKAEYVAISLLSQSNGLSQHTPDPAARDAPLVLRVVRLYALKHRCTDALADQDIEAAVAFLERCLGPRPEGSRPPGSS